MSPAATYRKRPQTAEEWEAIALQINAALLSAFPVQALHLQEITFRLVSTELTEDGEYITCTGQTVGYQRGDYKRLQQGEKLPHWVYIFRDDARESRELCRVYFTRNAGAHELLCSEVLG